jgi:2',3'-cyclic-nucleotide 2'-phosphodiesterase/3'-nucleotidase
MTGCDGNDDKSHAPAIADPNSEEKSKEPEGGDIIKIMHLNDTHGAVEYLPESGEVGMSYLAGYVNSKRQAANTDVVLISSGDMFQGSIDSNVSQGKLMIDIMKEMRFDSMSIGNHDFDWGVDVLAENFAYAMNKEHGGWALPFLSGNILNPQGEYAPGYLSTTFNRGGARISVIGSIDGGVYDSIDAARVEGYEFVSATKMVVDEAERLRKAGSDLIIYSTHDADKRVDASIASYVDAVFTGHNHHLSTATMVAPGTTKVVPVIESSCNGRAIGEVNFRYDEQTDSYQLLNYKNTSTSTIDPLVADEAVQAIYDSYLDAPVQDGPITADSLRSLKYDAVGEINESSIFASTDFIGQSSVLSIFMLAQLDAYETTYDVDASAYNASRSSWPVGEITYSDIYKAFPFDNDTVVVEATGAQLSRWNTPIQFAEGLTKYNLVSTQVYRVVSSTYVLNNNEVGNFAGIVHTDTGVYQRHVMYQEFKKATTPNPWG